MAADFFLLTRAADLAVMGVHLHDVDIVGVTATATSADACIVLVLPPQHVQEQTTTSAVNDDVVLGGELSGPSRLAFALAPETSFSLTVDGVLAACTHLRPGGTGPLDTSIELPSRLALGPLAGLSRHPAVPLSSSASVAGVWLARLISATGGPLLLRALDPQLAGSGDGVDQPSLTADQRLKVAGQATELTPIRATRLEVSTRGGQLTAVGEWDGISWSHRVSGGRDQFVRVDERVILYPFGFHAVLTTLTERDPDVNAVPAGGPAVLRRTVTLRLADTMISSPDGSAMSRTFPFDCVEVTRSVFDRLGTPEPSYRYKRVVPSTQALIDESREKAADAQVQREIWGPYVDYQVRDYEDLRRRGDSRVDQLYAAWEEQAAAGPDAEWLAAENQAYADAAAVAAGYDERLAALTSGFEGPDGPDPSVAAEIAKLTSASNQAWAEARSHIVSFETSERIRLRLANATALVNSLVSALGSSVGQPRDVYDAVYLYDTAPEISNAAQTYLNDLARVADLDRQVLELTALVHSETITAWPTNVGSGRVSFPVRLSRGGHAIDVRMPMILVYDYSVEESVEFGLPAYRSLDDPQLPMELDTAWAGPLPPAHSRRTDTRNDGRTPRDSPPIDVTHASVLDTGGVLFDLVGAAVPKPSDTQVLRTINLVGGLGLGGALFTPSLGRLPAGVTPGRWAANVGLPQLQTLAGTAGTDGGAFVSFAREYVEQGEAAKVLFETVGQVGVDFTKAADRSGGLAALQLAADGIARDHGLVQVAGLLANPNPADLIGEAATLLGFKLRDLLELAPDLEPPTMVSETVDGGRPQVTLKWHAGPLNDLLAFKASPTTRLDLTVLARVDGVVTDCEVVDFALQFPFDDAAALVRLDFGRIQFHQQTTYGVDVTPGVGIGAGPSLSLDVAGQVITHPPKLAIDGFDVTFLGPLKLLESLQDAVTLAGQAPGIKAGPKGVIASFAAPVPPVACGVFALSNLTFRSEVEVPFDERSVAVSIGFASRDKPFSLSVLSFAGGGYIDVRIDADGPAIEASLEFGAQLSVDFVVAKGEVHALGGVQYVQNGARVAITGYLRIGGSLEILRIVSVSVELRIALAYDVTPRPRLVGRATLVLEIDLTLWSDSIEIDSGEWVLQGGGSRNGAAGPALEAASDPPDGLLDDPATAFAVIDGPVTDAELAAWQAYRGSFRGVHA